MSKKLFEICIGGGYGIQPRHKSMILPNDYLLAFCNVDSDDQDEVVNFCNDYQVNPIWMFKERISLIDGFKAIKDEFSPVIGKILEKKPLSYQDIVLLNKHLSAIQFKASIRKEPLEMIIFEKQFDLLVPSGADYKIKFLGVPDVEPKNASALITFEKQAGIPLMYESVKEGLFEIDKYFPDERWDHYLKYKDRIAIETRIFNESNNFSPIRVEQKIYLQKNDFGINDIDAVYSCPTLESQLAHLIWDILSYKREYESTRRCVICGSLYVKGKQSKSAYYCLKAECKKEWENRQYKKRYENDEEFRVKKIKQSTLNKRKPIN